MKKHPDCEDRCQILEHKGYYDCTNTGRCEFLEAMTDTKAVEHECEEDTSDWPDDKRLDDPRRGQAQWINRER